MVGLGILGAGELRTGREVGRADAGCRKVYMASCRLPSQ